MIVEALEVFLGKVKAGMLVRYRSTDTEVMTRFLADGKFVKLMRSSDAPTMSLSLLTQGPDLVPAFYADIGAPRFNGYFSKENLWLLPPFWQNLLPEGVFRDRIAELRGCDPRDHMNMLAACGRGLPGNVYARPVDLTRAALSNLVTQGHDALEMSVFNEPLQDGESISGVQPKLAVMLDQGRFVARTHDAARDTDIIAKLMVVGRPLLPVVEDLSLRLAKAAGVAACNAYLAPMSKLQAEQDYDLGEVEGDTQFLAVERFDRITIRGRHVRVHWEDFAQVLGVMPEGKYTQSYEVIGRALMAFPSLGEGAVHELLRRLAVNEMLGNLDMHLKNIGVIYADGRTPRLAPAFDIVAYSAYGAQRGHALALLAQAGPLAKLSGSSGQSGAGKPSLTPKLLREFCERLGIAEKPAASVLRQCAAAAFKAWPEMIASSGLTTKQKKNLSAHFSAHPWIAQLSKRASRRVE